MLAENLSKNSICNKLNQSSFINRFATPYNFGPYLESNKTVLDLTKEILKNLPGNYRIVNNKK